MYIDLCSKKKLLVSKYRARCLWLKQARYTANIVRNKTLHQTFVFMQAFSSSVLQYKTLKISEQSLLL